MWRFLPEDWYIPAFGQIDDQGILFALAQVIFPQTCSEPARLCPNDRILLWIVNRLASKHFDRQQRLFDFALSGFQVPLDREPQEPAEAVVT
jgi:hypothetical protein